MSQSAGKKNSRIFCARRRGAALLTACIMLSGLFLSACSNISDALDRFTNGVYSVAPQNVKLLDATNFVRLLTTCISDVEQTKSIYDLIPDQQLDHVSYAAFEEYISVLSRLNSRNGALSSFQIVSDASRQSLLKELSDNLPESEELIESTVPVALTFDSEVGESATYIYYQEKEDGTAFLSEDWVTQCLELYNFSELYFSSLEDQNVDAVYYLISDSISGRDYSFSEEIIRLKVLEMCRFYQFRVKPTFDEYKMLSMDISCIHFEQSEVLDDELIDYSAREIIVCRNDTEKIVVRDIMTNPLNDREIYLYYQNERAVRIGDRANSTSFNNLFGEPFLMTVGREIGVTSNEGGEPEITRSIVIDYPSVSITIAGQIQSRGDWEGVITRIHIRSDSEEYSLGRTVYTGMTRDEFMEIYPFADQTDYVLSAEIDNQIFALEVLFAPENGDVLTDIRIEMIEDNSGADHQ